MVTNLKKEHPDFSLDSFQKWATETLVPRVLTEAHKNPEYIEKHTGEMIKNLHKTKQLPLPWELLNVSSVEVFPQDHEPNTYRFLISMRAQVREVVMEEDKNDKEKKIPREITNNVLLILATKLNEDNVWILTEYQVVEKVEALF